MMRRWNSDVPRLTFLSEWKETMPTAMSPVFWFSVSFDPLTRGAQTRNSPSDLEKAYR